MSKNPDQGALNSSPNISISPRSAHERRHSDKWLLIPVIGCSLFVIWTTIAMLGYPGGTFLDPTSPGYDFIRNYFSDLGRTMARIGGPNEFSRVSFAVAAVSAGLGLLPYFLTVFRLFSDRTGIGKILRRSPVFTIPTAMLYMLVGLAPADTMRMIHYGAMLLAFVGTILFGILQIIAILSHPHFPRVYAGLYLGLTLLVMGFIIFKIWGPPDTYPEGLVMQVIVQKITIYGEMLIISVQSIGAYRVARKMVGE